VGSIEHGLLRFQRGVEHLLDNIVTGIKGLWFFCWGNLFAVFTYDRKYLKGKYFAGKLGGIKAIGWRWVCTDCMSRLFLGINKGIKFPVSPRIIVSNSNNISFHVDDLNNFQGLGNYFQSFGGKIMIGKGTYIGPNVGLITTNHDIYDPDLHVASKDIVLGEKCWIGMNSIVLPGVVLGPHTTVAAGSVVTKSFSEGYCVIAGNPAKIITHLKEGKQDSKKRSRMKIVRRI